MIVAAIGLAMMVPNLVSFSSTAPLVVAVELQVRSVEEPHLRRLHGDEYRSYASRRAPRAPAWTNQVGRHRELVQQRRSLVRRCPILKTAPSEIGEAR
ncbi:MAG: hypothetical protein WBB27_14230 [Maribacter sp.]